MPNPLSKVISAFRQIPESAAAQPHAREKVFDKDITKTVQIDTQSGAKEVVIHTFNALDGWKVKHQIRDYAISTDSSFRKQLTLLVLSQAAVDGQILGNEKAINDFLGRWENIELVFNTVLDFNHIDSTVTAGANNVWRLAGSEIATTFMVHMDALLAPAMDAMFKGSAKDEQGEE